MAENLKQETVLVTAASGKTGRRVAERLAALGVDVRAGSRKGEVRFDWEDGSGWARALDGADAAYVAYYPDLAAPGAPEVMRAFGRVAAESGVRRLVLLSGRGEPEAVVAEGALRESGVDLTVVRSSFFAQNFSEGAMYEGVLAGEIPFPAGETAEPFIDADDLADVVVKILTEEGHAGLVHEVTGPRPVTFGEVAAEIGGATGREVRYVPVSGAQYAEMLQRFGIPEPESQWLADLFTMLLDGHNASVTNGVRQLLGREPKTFAAFARDAAQAGAWSA
ncbi:MULTISPECIES: NAD(P)H-binding protein [unclassified Streptomyces]|uniref:NmrA family NAD(P)-binding protein n=1 Tax=unclassified Streptomyces TaxID=2593676 RepID=UPI002DD7E0D6|nr:NAD(P)H-binding protein [Streptomyces sp. NBC_01750]WSA99093.1 NAD(P)H-binding protein [Streptomyces sp. NBC_01794]WSD36342.1 NAD(P)H-binding protein [Streptomyces sp. NBC_01750]